MLQERMQWGQKEREKPPIRKSIQILRGPLQIIELAENHLHIFGFSP